MTPLGILVACAGNWQGTNILQDPNTGSPNESESSLVVTPVLEGQFVRVDYTWSYQGAPQKGSLVLRTEAPVESTGTPGEAGPASIRAHWTDSWHMSEKVMECRGPIPEGLTIKLVGSWTPPEGPDWGWRIELTSDSTERAKNLGMVMYIVWPDGDKEALAVEAMYTRAAA